MKNRICEICGKIIPIPKYMGEFENICSSKCFSDKFWERIISKKQEYTISDGECYHFDKENLISEDEVLGFGGREFEIIFLNGEKYITNNLWSQGTVPEKFRERLPDNAKITIYNKNKSLEIRKDY